jgi:hypothetical protein
VAVPRRRELFHQGFKVDIGGRAFDLLLALIEARGSTLSKDQIMALVRPDHIGRETALRASSDYPPTTLAVALGFPSGDGTPAHDKLAASFTNNRHSPSSRPQANVLPPV